VRLQLLEEFVDGDLDIAVVEPDDHPERDRVLAHRVDEGAAELAVPAPAAQGPAHRVDDAVEWAGDLPDLLHAERPDLWILAGEPEAVERDAGQVTLRPFGEDGHPRRHVGAGLEVRERLAVAPTALVSCADPDRPRALDE
jgi:hypothetical protein